MLSTNKRHHDFFVTPGAKAPKLGVGSSSRPSAIIPLTEKSHNFANLPQKNDP
jgi:hypothetical protein